MDNVNGGARVGTWDLFDLKILNVWNSHSILTFLGNVSAVTTGHAFPRERAILNHEDLRLSPHLTSVMIFLKVL